MLSKTKITAILWPRKDKNGLSPIYIRVTINSVRTLVAANFAVDERYWDKKNEMVRSSHPEAETHNMTLLALKQHLNNTLAGDSLKGNNISAREFKKKVTGKDEMTLAADVNFFEFAETHLAELKATNKRNSETIYNKYNVLKRLEKILGHKNLLFSEMNQAFMTKIETALCNDYSKNTVEYTVVNLVAIINVAIKRHVILSKPFDNYELPKGEINDKEYLTIPELDAFEEYADDIKNPARYRAIAAWFLFGCYTGLRISDWFSFSFEKSIIGNEIRMKATKNKEYISIPIHKRLAKNLERLKTLPLENTSVMFNQTMGTFLKKVQLEKHLSSHCARKTFAVTMCGSLGINLEDCAQLMGISIEVCQKNYYRITKQTLHKKALDKWKDL